MNNAWSFEDLGDTPEPDDEESSSLSTYMDLADSLHDWLTEITGDCPDVEDDALCFELAERVFEKGYLK